MPDFAGRRPAAVAVAVAAAAADAAVTAAAAAAVTAAAAAAVAAVAAAAEVTAAAAVVAAAAAVAAAAVASPAATGHRAAPDVAAVAGVAVAWRCWCPPPPSDHGAAGAAAAVAGAVGPAPGERETTGYEPLREAQTVAGAVGGLQGQLRGDGVGAAPAPPAPPEAGSRFSSCTSTSEIIGLNFVVVHHHHPRLTQPTLGRADFPTVIRLRVGWLNGSSFITSTGAYGVPREQKMLKGLLPRVIYHQVYQDTKIKHFLMSTPWLQQCTRLGIGGIGFRFKS